MSTAPAAFIRRIDSDAQASIAFAQTMIDNIDAGHPVTDMARAAFPALVEKLRAFGEVAEPVAARLEQEARA